MSNLTLIDNTTLTALNNQVKNALGSKNLEAFHRAFAMAEAIQTLKNLLTPEVMQPVMSLQGSQLGFKTDKDKSGGYDIETVKNCIITATLQGLMPVGNQFNIIAGNCYVTKEGFEYLLPKVEGLRYTVTHELPRIQGDKAAVMMVIEWCMFGGATEKKSIEFPIKTNQYSTPDAVIGKGKRKAYAWLYSQVTGVSMPEGDVSEITPSRVVETVVHDESHRIIELLRMDYDSLEQFETNVVQRMSKDLLEQFSLEIEIKRSDLQNMKRK